MNVSHSAVSAGGLVLDIGGALLLALGLMAKRPSRAIEESTPKYGFNADLDANLATQTADAQVGAALLVAGFAAQFASALGAREATWLAVGAASAAALAIDVGAVVVLFRWWRPFHLRRMLEARLNAPGEGDLWTIAAAYGPFLREPAPPDVGVDNTIADYAATVLGPTRWKRYAASHQLHDVYTKLRCELAGTNENDAAHPQSPPPGEVA